MEDPTGSPAPVSNHSTVQKIPIHKIYASPHQMRKHFDETSLKELARSIKLEGLIQPITVRPVGQAFELVVGERRFRAVQMLEWEVIDARVLDLSDEDAAIKGLIENLQRQDLSVIEEARGYKQLIDPPYKMTQKAIGQRVGKSQTAIARSLALFELPEEIQELMPRGIVTEAHTRQLRKVNDRNRQIELAKHADREGWTVKETERRVHEALRQAGQPIHKRTSPKKEDDPLAEIWSQLLFTPHVGTPGTWKAHYSGKGQWQFQIKTKSQDPRTALGDFFVRLGMALGSRLVSKNSLPLVNKASKSHPASAEN